MRTFSLLAILTVLSGTLFTSAAPLDLAVDVAATVDGPVGRSLVANGISGARETLERFHDRGDTTSSTKRDATAVGARGFSILALTKHFQNLIHDSALPDTHMRQPQPITDPNVQARAEAQVDAVANVDLLLKRDPASVEARTEARVDAMANVDLLLKRDPAIVGARTEAQVDAVANVDLLLKRDPATIEARTKAEVDTAANVDLLLI